MRRRRQRPLAVTLLAGWSLLACPGFAVSQQGKGELDRIYADWAKRYDRTRACLYRFTCEATRPRGADNLYEQARGEKPSKTSPPRDIHSTSHGLLVLDLEKGRHRRECELQIYDGATDKLYPEAKIEAFDGQALTVRRPRHLNTHPSRGLKATQAEFGVFTGHMHAGLAFDMGHFPIFFSHGIVPWMKQQVVPGKLKVEPPKEVVYVHGRAIYQGRSCLVLRTRAAEGSSYDEYWVDPPRESAIVRYTNIMSGKPYIHFDIEHQATPEGWLVQRWTYTQREVRSGATVVVMYGRVVDRQVNQFVEGDLFRLKPESGMLVYEGNFAPPKPGQTWVDVARPTKTLLARVEENGGLREVEFVDGVERAAASRWWRWWWVAALIAALLSLVWLVDRRRRRLRRLPNAGRTCP